MKYLSIILFALVKSKQQYETFWLHDTITFNNPPILSILNYTYPDYLTISCVQFQGTPDNFKNPYFNMTFINMITPDDIKILKSAIVCCWHNRLSC